jgi:hypothetical protein
MAIKDTLDEYSFVSRFLERRDNFSPNALQTLYHYFDDLSEGIGEDIEFDPIAICCDWTEYENEKECLEDYDFVEDMEEIRTSTVVLPVHGGSILVQNY